MELEMKYAVPDKATCDAIWEDDLIKYYADPSSMEKLVMKAVYFDTEDGKLSANNMAVRVRYEGDTAFATLKWNGSVSNGFHEREEINVPARTNLSTGRKSSWVSRPSCRRATTATS